MIFYQYVEGKALREVFDDSTVSWEIKLELSSQLGSTIAVLHNGGIVHGDLTTSNVILRLSNKRLVLIDFGLAKFTPNSEDKAVDLYVLERAFSSTHPISDALFQRVFESYSTSLNPGDASKVIEKFRIVQRRGRKRDMIG